MPTIFELIEPFFAWKQGPNGKFAESSRVKYLPLLEGFGDARSDAEQRRFARRLLHALTQFADAWPRGGR